MNGIFSRMQGATRARAAKRPMIIGYFPCITSKPALKLKGGSQGCWGGSLLLYLNRWAGLMLWPQSPLGIKSNRSCTYCNNKARTKRDTFTNRLHNRLQNPLHFTHSQQDALIVDFVIIKHVIDVFTVCFTPLEVAKNINMVHLKFCWRR